MWQIQELYGEILLDHSQHPRNFGKLDPCTHSAQGHNPLCGDQVTISLRLEGGTIVEIRFDGQGCAISQASASMLTEALTGKTVEEAEAMFHKFHNLLTLPEVETEGQEIEELGELVTLAGVRRFPIRIKCATLPWHTFEAAITNRSESVTTEK